MLAHIRNGELVKLFPDDRGWFTLEDGRKVSPPIAGFVDGNDIVLPVVNEFQDTSTGTVPTISNDTGWQIEADRVYRLVTVRDMTAQEIDDRKQQQAGIEVSQVLADIQRRAMNVTLFGFNELRAQHGLPALTLNQYVALLNGPEGDGPITKQQFLNYVKSQL